MPLPEDPERVKFEAGGASPRIRPREGGTLKGANWSEDFRSTPPGLMVSGRIAIPGFHPGLFKLDSFGVRKWRVGCASRMERSLLRKCS